MDTLILLLMVEVWKLAGRIVSSFLSVMIDVFANGLDRVDGPHFAFAA